MHEHFKGFDYVVSNTVPQGNYNEIIVDRYTRADVINTVPQGNHN